MSYLEEVLPEYRKGAKIRRKCWVCGLEGICKDENYSFNAFDVDADDWEKVPDKPIDWDYIIKNKCLCWFWDSDEKRKCMGILKETGNFIPTYKFINHNNVRFKNCRPVPRDEVTFYEERKDGNI